MRLLADQTAKLLAGMAQALNALAALVADPARFSPQDGGSGLRVADWLPAFVNAARAFVTISAVALFWIVTAWPSGAGAITWVALTLLLLAARGDQAYAAAMSFTVGTLLAAIFAAVTAFAVLPWLSIETFGAFGFIIGFYLVPAGALMRQPRLAPVFIPMTLNFVPLLAPSNPMQYDQAQFYNQALAVLVGVGAAALSFRLLPPLSPALRARRLLALTLRDLRRLAAGHARRDWEGHVHGRLLALPDEATPLQRAQILAALAVGNEIVHLRRIAHLLWPAGDLEPALAAVAHGDSATAAAHLACLDAALAAHAAAAPGKQIMLRARAGALTASEALTRHAAYFDGGARIGRRLSVR
ncbi:MAG: FUSC family protein [Hyphomicrobiales bacterium]|nr:FUSC family protein [Hyphomicrobiales bacterium]